MSHLQILMKLHICYTNYTSITMYCYFHSVIHKTVILSKVLVEFCTYPLNIIYLH
jgi:hypothetical protein